MSDRVTLLWQLDVAASLFDVVVDGLGEDEALRAPAPGAWSVRRADDGSWRADWADVEPDPAPAPSIAWLLWHICWWWSDVTARAFGPGPVAPGDVAWPGSAAAMIDRVHECRQRWTAAVEAMSAGDLESVEIADRCWPLRGHPFSHVVAWVTVELTKNSAEIGATRRLLREASPAS